MIFLFTGLCLVSTAASAQSQPRTLIDTQDLMTQCDEVSNPINCKLAVEELVKANAEYLKNVKKSESAFFWAGPELEKVEKKF